MGFTPGIYCKRKTEKVAMECQIQSVEGKTVQFKELKSGGLFKIDIEDFIDPFQIQCRIGKLGGPNRHGTS